MRLAVEGSCSAWPEATEKEVGDRTAAAAADFRALTEEGEESSAELAGFR